MVTKKGSLARTTPALPVKDERGRTMGTVLSDGTPEYVSDSLKARLGEAGARAAVARAGAIATRRSSQLYGVQTARGLRTAIVMAGAISVDACRPAELFDVEVDIDAAIADSRSQVRTIAQQTESGGTTTHNLVMPAGYAAEASLVKGTFSQQSDEAETIVCTVKIEFHDITRNAYNVGDSFVGSGAGSDTQVSAASASVNEFEVSIPAGKGEVLFPLHLRPSPDVVAGAIARTTLGKAIIATPTAAAATELAQKKIVVTVTSASGGELVTAFTPVFEGTPEAEQVRKLFGAAA